MIHKIKVVYIKFASILVREASREPSRNHSKMYKSPGVKK